MTKGEQTRQHIIEKAAPVFNKRGFAGCSMQDLMDATGLEKGGIYRHFTGKEELAAEAFQYAWTRVVETRMGDLAQVRGAVPRLRHIAHSFVHVRSPIPGGCPLMNAAADVDNRHKAVLTSARQGLSAWKSQIREILQQGIRNGELRSDIEPDRIANAIISLLEGALMLSRLEGTREALLDAEASIESLLDTFAR